MKKAMIFAAGMGTRLFPLTNDRPKALVKVAGKTMLEHTIEKLQSFGIKEMVINVHHYADFMIDYISKLNYRGINFHISDESDQLLDTGGGLLKAKDFFDDSNPFIAHNVDIISDIDLAKMYKNHINQDALISLAVANRQSTRYLMLDGNRLCGWQNIQTNNKVICFSTLIPPQNLAFSGIHVIDPKLFNLMKETGKFSITKTYLRLAISEKIIGFEHDADYWADLGTTEKIANAEKMIEENPEKFNYI